MFQTRLAGVRLRTIDVVGAAWDALPDYHKTTAATFAAGVVPTVIAGQAVTARTTAAYVTRRARLQAPALDLRRLTGAAVRNGRVDPLTEYQRPFGQVWHALETGEDLPTAVGRGRSYAVMLAAADLALSMRATAGAVADAVPETITFTRAADVTACEECSAADGEPYESASGMGLHPFCGCSLEPVRGEPPADAAPADPGAFTVDQHDELGAVIAPAA